jgi:hypothetical protein
LYKSGLDIYHWGAGLAVTGRIRDIGQNVSQTSFKQKQQQPQLSPHLLPSHISFGGLDEKHSS